MDEAINVTIEDEARAARVGLHALADALPSEIDHALLHLAEALEAHVEEILYANQEDISKAEEEGLNVALIDRLRLNVQRISGMCESLRQIAALPHLVGEVTGIKTTTRGLRVGRMRAPLGVIGMIYEARPNVTVDAAALCLKSGNAVILRGGHEAEYSNCCLFDLIQQSLLTVLNDKMAQAVQRIDSSDRAYVAAMLRGRGLIDVIIPRGGHSLVDLVSREARVPVLKHLDGNCHIYVDEDADPAIAWDVVENGKTYRYGICGATESLLVHEKIAEVFLPRMAAIFQQHQVEMRGDAQVCALLGDVCQAAEEEDWGREYLAPIISIAVVADVDAAIAHINRYGSHHTDAIISNNLSCCQRFLRQVDSASVMVNTPTCFADGFEYGLGAEIGISTDKIHWRGPVGLQGLTCEKFIVLSQGILR